MIIDIVSDVICPWCYVGQKRLDKALALRPDLDVILTWRPFQLAPEIPPEGVDRRAYLKAKFGENAGRGPMMDALRQSGRDEGIDFQFDRIVKTPNTLNAHRLIFWAGALGAQDAIVRALFAAYFEEGRDIGDPAVLTDLAVTCGMDRERVSALLASDSDMDRMQHDLAMAHKLGIGGVPTFVIERRFMIQGAQDAEQLAAAFDQIAAQSAA
jgi:predicted DsbA family dithiol-disulfide isomerase